MDGSVDVESGLRPERAWRKGGSRPEDGKGKAEGLGGAVDKRDGSREGVEMEPGDRDISGQKNPGHIVREI